MKSLTLPVLFVIALALPACGNDEVVSDAAVVIDSPRPDAPPPFTVLADFDAATFELAEGVTSIAGVPFVSLAPQGRVVRVPAGGAFTTFGTLPGTPADVYVLGLAPDTMGRIYVGVGASGPAPVPAPGIYRIPAAGGPATVFALHAQMSFPNALDFDGTLLYATDSGSGTIFEVATNGTATIWLQDPLLAGDQTACGGSGAGFDIGANGIVHDATNRYVAVTDFGRIVRVPIMPNGSAGTPVVLSEDCATLQGADGIALDTDGSIIVARNGPSNTLVRVSAAGARAPIHGGSPLDGPASVFIDAPGGDRRLLVTNSAFFSGASGNPALLAYDLP